MGTSDCRIIQSENSTIEFSSLPVGKYQNMDKWGRTFFVNFFLNNYDNLCTSPSVTCYGGSFNEMVGSIANDVAVVSQDLGAISEYDVTVEFQVRWP